MKAGTKLDSVVFRLTPTRTRYDLVIVANGESEKIASGLLDPFLAHLKSAKDQIEKGGYSIRLEPDRGSGATWFTKDTVERFVRYVSTPEVLERVNTLESEILQINEAITFQANDGLCSSSVEYHQSRWSGSATDRSAHSDGREKSVVLSKHGKHRRLSTGSITHEENSRHQLLRVLESRKTLLQKEQDMAFASAAAAGFGMDRMENLILFAKSFGASRMLEACLKFMDLWKAKRKDGQWIKVGVAEAALFQSEPTSTKASGCMFSEDICQQRQATGFITEDRRQNSDPQVSLGSQYYHGQIPSPMFPQWASHGLPISQSYPTQGMPYYQNHLVSDFEKATYRGGKSHKKVRNSRKRHSLVANGENMTQIGLDRDYKSGSDSRSASDARSDEEIQFLHSDEQSRRHKNSSRSTNSNMGITFTKTLNIDDKDQVADGQEGDGGNWQTFQKLLLRVQRESTSTVDKDMFSSEHPLVKKQTKRTQADSSILPARNDSDSQEVRVVDGDSINRNQFQRKQIASTDEMLAASSGRGLAGNHQNVQFDSESRGGRYSNLHSGSSHDVKDESFVVPSRSSLHEELVKGKKSVLDMNSDFHSARRADNSSSRIKNHHSYEPHDLRMIPDRGLEKASSSFDPAKDFDMQISMKNAINKESRSQENVSKRSRDGLKRSEKERILTTRQYGMEKRKTDAVTMKGRSSKLNPLADAKARAEKLRAFKADLQKAKKEKEEEERKRLEALKRERRKRIAARSSSNTARLQMDTPQTKAKKPTRLSPSSLTSSKFKSAEPTSVSPLRKMPRNSKSPRNTQQIGASKKTETTKPSPVSSKASPVSYGKMPRNSKSPRNVQQIEASRKTETTKPSPVSSKASPVSYGSSKFSDAEPANSSPLLKLLRRNKNVSQSTCMPQEMTVQKKIHFPTLPLMQKSLSSSNSAKQSTCNPAEASARNHTSMSLITRRGSKFGETVPVSAPPLQKLRTTSTSASPLESPKITKVSRLNVNTQPVRNGLRQSVSPVYGVTKDIVSPMEAGSLHVRARKVSNNEGSNTVPASLVRSVGSSQVERRTMPKELQVYSKPTTPSRLLISKESCKEVKKNPGMKNALDSSAYKSSIITGSMQLKLAHEMAFKRRNSEDEPIVEKSVLILENKTNAASTIRSSELVENNRVRPDEADRSERNKLVSEDSGQPTAEVPVAPLSAGEANDLNKCKPESEPGSHKVMNPPNGIVSRKHTYPPIRENQGPSTLRMEECTSSNITNLEEPEDQVPMVGSRRVACTCKSMDAIPVEQIHEMHERPHGKGSPKGFKDILKFRRKGQSSTSGELSAVHVSRTKASNNAASLKDLLSNDDQSECTPSRASRSFSLFTPFRNKNSEKKSASRGAFT